MYTLNWQPPYDWSWMLGFLAARAVSGVETVAEDYYARSLAVGEYRGVVTAIPDIHFKRKDVSVQTQVRFGWNARAFFYEQKQKEILHGNGHKKRSSAELQPLLTLNLIL